MEVDEIIYAVGELYLKYRKQQQVGNDLMQKLNTKEAEAEALTEQNEKLQKQVERLENPKPTRRAAK